MNDPLIQKYAQTAVPRYTSYPTAPHFQPGFPAETWGRWLAELPADTPPSLYFHIPFCDEMCWFCGCHTKVTKRYDPVARYVEHMLAEIDIVADKLNAAPWVTSIHWGGGSPTKLTPEDFAAIMGRVRERFDISKNAEIALEVDPRTLTPEFIEAMAAAGVNRASVCG